MIQGKANLIGNWEKEIRITITVTKKKPLKEVLTLTQKCQQYNDLEKSNIV
jgi:hypothetical protein